MLPALLGAWLQADDNCDYIIVMQEGEDVAPLEPLPELPPNARFLRHPNSCYNVGTTGWVVGSAGQGCGHEQAVGARVGGFLLGGS